LSAFTENIFLEDFYLTNLITHPVTNIRCLNYLDLFGKPFEEYVLLNEQGLLEIKLNNKKIYKGHLNSLFSNNVLFPLFNLKYIDAHSAKQSEVSIYYKIVSKGLVAEYKKNIIHFDSDKLYFLVNKKQSSLNLLGINYNDTEFKVRRNSGLIISQRCWIETVELPI
jgi:hypothetical protein